MKLKTKILQVIFINILFLLVPFTIGPTIEDVIPVIPLSSGPTTFTPTLLGNSSYYIVPSDFNGSQILYSGKDAPLEYTSNLYTGNTITSGTGSAVNNNNMPAQAITPESRSILNPLFKDEQLPVLVNVTANDSKLIIQNPVGLNLHMDRSLTFFFNQSINYYALINTTSPFFLDVNVINPSAQLYVDLSQTLFPSLSSYPLAKQLTIPIIPENYNLQAFEISTSNHLSSLVTITPLPFNPSQFGISKVQAGNYYTGSISQGQCYDIQSNPVSNNVLKIMNLKFFQFPVEAGNTYQIYYYHNNINDNFNQTYYQCQIGSLSAVSTDFPKSFNYVGGSLTNDATGLIINAKTNGYANVSLIASGLVQQDYGFYFLKNNQMTIPQNIQLPFNKAIYLSDSPNTYYTFNLTKPAMIALNYSSSININNVNFDWSQYNPTVQDYVYMMTSNLNAESGNLLNDSLGDIYTSNGGNYNWLYFPVGDYKLEVTGAQNQNGQYEFTQVPVQTFSSGSTNTTLNINLNSLYAVELPLNRADYNFFNASTVGQDNVSVTYEFAIIGKYSFLGAADTVPNANGNFVLGNKEVNGNWFAYPTNETNPLETYVKPTQTNFDPILLIRPYSAIAYNNNNTQYYSGNYTTSLTLSVTNGVNNYPTTNLVSSDIGSGYQIVIPGLITNQKTVPFNNDFVKQNAQVYAFYLSTTPDQLYNISIMLNGNYSTGSGFLNATFDTNHVWVHTGNFIDATVFGDKVFTNTNTSAICSLDFLSITSNGYLFVDINRHSLYNGTISVILTEIPVHTLSLYNQVQTFSWNKTISSYELLDTTPLWNVTNFNNSGGGLGLLVPLVIVTGGVVIVAAVAGGFYYMKKKQNTG